MFEERHTGGQNKIDAEVEVQFVGHKNNKITIGQDKLMLYLCLIPSGQMRVPACGFCLEMSSSWVFTEVPKHHRPGERRPFGPGATHLHSCASDASSRCCSQANQRSHPKSPPQVGGPLRFPTDSYFSLNLCPLSWLAVIRLSLNLTGVCRWGGGGESAQH